MKHKRPQKPAVIRQCFAAGFIVLWLLVILCACQPVTTQKADSIQPRTSSTVHFSTSNPTTHPSPTKHSTKTLETPTPQISPTNSGEEVDRTQYHLIASLDYQSHWMTIEERITYKNTSENVLDSLVLIVEPQRLADQFDLLELFWSDGSSVQDYTLQQGVLHIALTERLAPGGTLNLMMAFVYSLPARPAPFGYTSRQTNLANWYAFAPIYLPGEGWMVRAPASVGEHLVYAPAEYLVELRTMGESEELVVAAPSPEEMEGNVRRYHLTLARNFTLSISPEYILLQDQTTGTRAYVFPEHQAAGKTAVGCVRDALGLFHSLYGDPDLSSMTLVETTFPDGMEYDGLFFLNELYFEYPGLGAQGGLCTLSVHETAHQWWYRLVGNDPAYHPWLDEALCTFSELLFYENYYPDLVSWWWGYRVNDYQPQGWVNTSIYDTSDYRSYVNAVYLQGVRFLDSLRRKAGQPAMEAFLKAYAAEFRFGMADADGFLRVWETSTGQTSEEILERFFKQ